MKITCTICSNNLTRLIEEKTYDDRYGYPGYFELHECMNCRHKMLAGKFTEKTLKKLYTEYYPRSARSIESYEVPSEKRNLSSWLSGEMGNPYRWVPENVKVLDIGCGYGESLGYYKKRGCEAYGVEADENAQRVAKKYGLKIKNGLFNSKDYKPGFFDYVTMSQVIEHMDDPVKILKDIRKILADDGRLILSTPNASGWGSKIWGMKWINWHIPYHLNFFNKTSIGIAAENSGFELEKIKTITSPEWLYYQCKHILNFPEQGIPSAFWDPRVKKPGKKVWDIGLYLMKKLRIMDLTTRLMDGLGVGDNMLVVMRKKTKHT